LNNHSYQPALSSSSTLWNNPPFPHPALCETTRPFLIQPLWNNHILEYVFCEVV
jgi:hypothetical protein